MSGLIPSGNATHRVLAAIRSYRREYGASPSHREIERRAMVKRQHVSRHLRRLQEQGYLTWTPGEPCSIRLAMPGDDLSDIDLENANRARGWTVIKSPAPALADALPIQPVVPEWALTQLERLADGDADDT